MNLLLNCLSLINKINKKVNGETYMCSETYFFQLQIHARTNTQQCSASHKTIFCAWLRKASAFLLPYQADEKKKALLNL